MEKSSTPVPDKVADVIFVESNLNIHEKLADFKGLGF